MLHLEPCAADRLEAGYGFVGRERLRTTELDRLPLCRRMSQRKRTDLRHVAVRNPTNRTRAWAVDAGLSFCIIESQSRAQPYFHKPTGLNHREVQALCGFLDLLLRVAQRERDSR